MSDWEKKQLDRDRRFRNKHKNQNIKFRDRVGVIKQDGRRFEVSRAGYLVPRVQHQQAG